MEKTPVQTTWKEFQEIASRMIREAKQRPRGQWWPSYPLFRGQANSDWELKTTLQRWSPKLQFLSEYYELMRRARDSLASHQWDLDKELKVKPWLSLSGIPFMVHLRQNRFPSPLLDWTRSPYVAAFFAFRNVEMGTDRPTQVSIFAFQEFLDEKIDFHSLDRPWVQHIGPSIPTDKKHHLQQCEYTLCLHQAGDDWHLDAYDEVQSRHDYRGVFKQYNIVCTPDEQRKVLLELRQRGITAFDLFESEESRIERFAVAELFLDREGAEQTAQSAD